MQNFLRSKLSLYFRLIRLDKPIGIMLLLWPTLWAIFSAANGWPSLHILFVYITGTILMRSAGCAMNDYFDRDIDKYVKRTENRVLTAGLIQPREALWVALSLGIASLMLVIGLNTLTLVLAVVAAILAITYPLFNRFFAIPQAYLGIAFGFGIPMGFASILDTIPLAAWLMLLANVCWAIAYDTEYAMVDRDDDIRLGLKTSAITFGSYDIFCVAIFYVLTLILLSFAGKLLFFGLPYFLGLTCACVIAVSHVYWIRHRDRTACFKAFLHNNWFGCAVFAGIFVETVFR